MGDSLITIKIFIQASDLYLLMKKQEYTHIRIYQGDTEEGSFSEITTTETRIPLQIGIRNYTYFVDVTDKWFKYSFGNDSTESAHTAAFQNQLGDPDKVGFTFGNYVVPEGIFGEVLTHDDIKHTFMWGIDLIAQDSASSAWEPSQTQFEVLSAVKDFEKYLGIDIIRRKYKTEPEDSDIRVDEWMAGDNNIYTDEEYAYPFDVDQWRNFGFIQLNHRPIITVSRAQLKGPTTESILNLIEWIRVNKRAGQLNAYPKNQMIFGPPAGGFGSFLLWQTARYPQALHFDYETGFENAAKVPQDLREVIGKWCAVKMLAVTGDGILPGFSSQSLSLDGLSESFSSTQSATSAYFGARIKQYTDDIKDWLARNRYKYGGIPLGFVGGS
jgi:hypothetical protein